MIETISFLDETTPGRYYESIFEKKYEEVEEAERFAEQMRQEIKIRKEQKEREEKADVLASLLEGLL